MLLEFFYVVLPLMVTVGLLRKYCESKRGNFHNNTSLRGKVVIITGANSGIGLETTRCLAQRNAKVIMACRNIKKAKQAITDIRRTTSNGEMIPLYLDLQSFDSIKTFANIIIQDFPKIHILINNAGVYVPCVEKCTTVDGFELHYQVNYLGHFLLTKLLMDRLQESAPSRIIVLSSTLHERGIINLETMNAEPNLVTQSRFNQLYCNSKLMNAYFAFEMSKKLKNSGISVYAVCPGWCRTGLMRYSSLEWYKWPIFIFVALFFLKSANQGCQTVVYCATDEELEVQKEWLYRDCKKYNSKHSFDSDISAKLWSATENVIVETYKL